MNVSLPKLLNSSLAEERRIRPVSLNIQENIVPLTTASMIILQEDAIPDRSYVELFTVNGSAGIFRTRAPEASYGSGKTVTISLEHAICEVGDYLVRNEGDQEQKTLAAALQHFFGYYSGSKWQLGTVSATGNVIVQDNYQSVLSAMISAIAQIPSAMMTFNFSSTPWTINVVSRETTVSAEGRLSRNVDSARIKRDDSSLCTRVWLEGLGTNGAIGKMDADTIGTYGVVERKLSGSGYTQAQAQTVANNYLAKHKRLRYTITINALDLSRITGETLDRIAMGKLYRLAIPEDNVTVEENVTAITWPDVYGKPESCTVTLAEEAETSITFLQEQQQANKASQQSTNNSLSDYSNTTNSRISDVEEDIDWVWEKSGIDSLGQQETLMTRIQVNAQSIQTEVSRATAAENSKIEKTSSYATVDSIINRAQELASAAESSAKNASIAKTVTYQSADAIYQAAVRAAETDAGNTYIQKTAQYQTAAAIVTAAEDYVDGELLSYSTTTQTAAMISQEVASATSAASIVLGINAQSGSYVKIKADAIDIQGVVSATDAKIDNLMSGQSVARWITAETLHCQQHFYFGPDQSAALIGPINVTISGTAYTFLGVVT